MVGFGTGGGFDAYARMIGPPLGKALDATVVVENQPGAGGIIALNRVAASPPDGLTMMIVDGTPAALGQLLGQENVRYDLAKLGPSRHDQLDAVRVAGRRQLAGEDARRRRQGRHESALGLGRPDRWPDGHGRRRLRGAAHRLPA